MSAFGTLKDIILKYYGHTVTPGVMGLELYNNATWVGRGPRVALGISAEFSRFASAGVPILAYAHSQDIAAVVPWIEFAVKNYLILTAGLLPAVNIFSRLGRQPDVPKGIGAALEQKVQAPPTHQQTDPKGLTYSVQNA